MQTENEILFPNLNTFVGAHFRPQWKEAVAMRGEDPVKESVLACAIKNDGAPYLTSVSTDITRLLAKQLPETELRRIIRKEFHANIEPNIDGMTMKDWLQRLRDRIDERLRAESL